MLRYVSALGLGVYMNECQNAKMWFIRSITMPHIIPDPLEKLSHSELKQVNICELSITDFIYIIHPDY